MCIYKSGKILRNIQMFLNYSADFKTVNCVFQVVPFTMVSPLKPSVHFPSNPRISRSLHIPFVIWSSESLVSIIEKQHTIQFLLYTAKQQLP